MVNERGREGATLFRTRVIALMRRYGAAPDVMRNRNKSEESGRERGKRCFLRQQHLLILPPSFSSVFTVIVEYGDVTASENGSALTRATLGGPESLDADRGSARRNSISRPCPSSACSTCGQCQLPILHLGGRREGDLPKILLSGALINNWGFSRLLGDGR